MPRLPRDAVNYIKYAQASYSEIIQQVRKQWNRNISKGLVSYYEAAEQVELNHCTKRILIKVGGIGLLDFIMQMDVNS